ncbi:FAD-binding oxidoreductase [Frateuria aurantia]
MSAETRVPVQRTARSRLTAAFEAEISQLLGTRWSQSEAVRDHHGRDESSYPPMPPDGVAFVQSTEEVAAVLKLCQAHRVPVIPYGNGSSVEGHVLAVEGGISLDISGMSGLLELHPEDFTVSVQPGLSRRQLNEELRHTGLFFPIDPGADASIGGMCATSASGTNAVRYGTMRENVLALTVVLIDGRVIRTGTRARKSSAGYDLTHLFIGSEGTLGVITEVTLRLHPQPEQILAATCSFPRIGAAVSTVVQIIQYGMAISRVEFIDALAVRAINRHAHLQMPEQPTLFFEFAGSPAAVQEQVAIVSGLVAEAGGSGFAWAEQQEDRNRLWHARHQAYFAALQLKPGCRAMATDVCVPISRLAECVEATVADLADASIPAPIVGHVGDGNFHLIMLVDPDRPEEWAEAEQINRRLVARAIAMDGSCSGEHGIGLHKQDFLRDQVGDDAVEVMRSLKRTLDPLNLMNPGKIFAAAVPQ